MTTLLAPNLIAALQRHARVTLSAQVSDNRTVHRAGEAIAEGILAAEGGDLVGFAGHSVSIGLLRLIGYEGVGMMWRMRMRM